MDPALLQAAKPIEVHAATGVLGEPEPPPVVVPLAEPEPPPVRFPPPPSREIIEPPSEPVATPAGPSPPKLAEEPPVQEQVAKHASAPVAAAAVEPATDARSVAMHADLPPAKAAAPASPELPPAMTPTPDQKLAAYALALSLMTAGTFGMAPALWEVVLAAQFRDGSLVARWALMVLALGVLHWAYAAYLAQVPDWTSGRVVTLFSLAMAAIYAALAGVTVMGGPESFLVRGLELGEVLASGKAVMWCLCMTTMMATLAYFAGRTSARWRAGELRG
jgi:hypothetical protein